MDECCDNIDDMLHELNVPFRRNNRRYYGPCPVHGGNNQMAWNLYPEGTSVRGYWCCRTHLCEQKWKKNLIGFVHGVLSREGNVAWFDALNWMVKFLGYTSVDDIKAYSNAEIKAKSELRAICTINSSKSDKTVGWSRETVRKPLQIPAPYFLNRGYKKETLDRYDVGYLDKQKRIVVPVYDSHYTKAVGFTKRSIYEKCPSCGHYHAASTSCPESFLDKLNASKWKNSDGFEAANYLYNYWFSREHIIQSQTIILVEGPADVWRLEEAGIKNSVALFGVNLTDEQIALIESSWAMNIIVWLDSDEAGQNAAQIIKKHFSSTHRLFFPKIDIEDDSADVSAGISDFVKEISKLNREIGVS